MTEELVKRDMNEVPIVFYWPKKAASATISTPVELSNAQLAQKNRSFWRSQIGRIL